MNRKVSLLLSLLIATTASLSSCSIGGPSDSEVLELAKKDFTGSSRTFLVEIKIEGRKSSKDLYGQKVFPVTVKCDYVSEGFKTGWIAGGGSSYFEPYCDDTEYNSVREYLLGKDNFDRWAIVDSRNGQTETTTHRRPASKSMESFYGARKH